MERIYRNEDALKGIWCLLCGIVDLLMDLVSDMQTYISLEGFGVRHTQRVCPWRDVHLCFNRVQFRYADMNTC